MILLRFRRKIKESRNRKNYCTIEGVYSMGGDLAPIEIFKLADNYKIFWL